MYNCIFSLTNKTNKTEIWSFNDEEVKKNELSILEMNLSLVALSRAVPRCLIKYTLCSYTPE